MYAAGIFHVFLSLSLFFDMRSEEVTNRKSQTGRRNQNERLTRLSFGMESLSKWVETDHNLPTDVLT